MHDTTHSLAGKTVRIKSGDYAGHDYRIEDWWDHLTGKGWGESDGNPACINYAIRAAMVRQPLPDDDEVVYGKIGAFGYLVHVSELGDPAEVVA